MNMSFYSAAVGAYQQQLRMNVQANNIANVNTSGFRAERAAFGELMNRNVAGIDGERLPKGTGTRMIQATVDFSSGGYKETGRDFDYAIDGDGFFALYDPATEEISFTRDGSFYMSQFFIPPAFVRFILTAKPSALLRRLTVGFAVALPPHPRPLPKNRIRASA